MDPRPPAATRIAVIGGGGAIGGVLVAWLAARAENEIFVCARSPLSELSVAVPGGRTIDLVPTVWLDPRDAEPVDWVVAATKTYDTPGALRWVERLLGCSTCLAVAQNGVEHMERFAGVVPRERTLPVIVSVGAERHAPGRVLQRRPGQLIVPEGELGQSFAALLARTPLATRLTDDFITEPYRKLALNSAGVVNALTLQPAGIIGLPKVAAIMHGIALETIRVGRAAGANLDDAVADEILDRARATSPDAINSLLADRLADRPLEIDTRNGVVVRLGEKYGIPTPLNAMAVAILEATSADR